jgi:hypothetical protein
MHVSSCWLSLLLPLLLVCYLGLLTWQVHMHACWRRPKRQALPPHIILVHLYSHANLQGIQEQIFELKPALVVACRNSSPGQHTAFCCFTLLNFSVTLQAGVFAEHTIQTLRAAALQTWHPQMLLVPHAPPTQGCSLAAATAAAGSLLLESAGFVCFCPCTNPTTHVFHFAADQCCQLAESGPGDSLQPT